MVTDTKARYVQGISAREAFSRNRENEVMIESSL